MHGGDAAVLDWPELVAAVAALDSADAVLEAGTGSGAMFRHLLRLLCAGGEWTLTTVDADRAALDFARTRIGRLPRAARQRVTMVEADLVDYARGRAAVQPRGYRVVVASALLSAVPHVRPWGAYDVLASLASLVAAEGFFWWRITCRFPRRRGIRLRPIRSKTCGAGTRRSPNWQGGRTMRKCRRRG
jgi:hypothetical protein